METRKDIGQAFKESLSQFKDSPNDFVWEQIELELKKKKKKKRPFIFWFRYGTVALIFLLLLFLNRGILLNFEENKLPSDENHLKKNNLSKKSSNNEIKLSDKKDSNENNYNHLNKEKSNENEKFTKSNNAIIRSNYNSKKSIGKTFKKSNSISLNNKLSNTITKKSNLENDSQDSKEVIFQNNSIKSDDKKYANNIIDSIQKILLDSVISDEKLVNKQVNKRYESENKDSIVTLEDEKWSIYPNVSAVFYDGFNKSFENQISFNYGLYLIYHASDKFDLRIGVNKLDLQQSYKENDDVLIQQNIRYLEIPLEFRYNFSNQKIKSHLVTGFSYLILDEAFISTSESNFATNDFNTSMFNKSTISLNVGLSFQTKIYKNFSLNVEPIFKFHLRPFMDTSEFDPYTISISTGIEYKF